MELEAARIAVLMGGISNERDVSLRSGEAVLSALREENFRVEGIDVKEDNLNKIAAELKSKNIDAAFIALHGRFGEDGKIQRMLETEGIPYTGSGVSASAVCFNKFLANTILESFEVTVPEYYFMSGSGRNGLPDFDFPVVVKPAEGGSAIGVVIVRDALALERGIKIALAEDKNILIEEYIEGREMTVSVIGDEDVRVLPLTEIKTDEEFYNYDAKYVPGKSIHVVPAELTAEEEKIVSTTAEKAYRILGCRGFARIDIILSGEGAAYVLDVNTIPGMTATSLFPESARAAGLSVGKLCRRLVEMAVNPGSG